MVEMGTTFATVLRKVHSSKKLREHIHYGKLMLKRTFLILTTRLMNGKQSSDINLVKNVLNNFLRQFKGRDFPVLKK